MSVKRLDHEGVVRQMMTDTLRRALVAFAVVTLVACSSQEVEPVAQEVEPVFTISVHCPFIIASDAVVIEMDQGPVVLNEHCIRLEHVSEECLGHTLKIRR
jgi:hypothetical protein